MKQETGLFIMPSQEQMGKIWAACALEGFPATSEGVLQLLMLAVEPDEDDEEDPVPEMPTATEALNEWLRKHPEQVQQVKTAGTQLLNRLLKRFKKPQ